MTANQLREALNKAFAEGRDLDKELTVIDGCDGKLIGDFGVGLEEFFFNEGDPFLVASIE